MELILLVLIAFVIGYLLAGSKFRKPIDDTADKVAVTSKSWGNQVAKWWRGLFKKNQTTASQIVDVSEETLPEQKQPAEKRPSRRKSQEEESGSETLQT